MMAKILVSLVGTGKLASDDTEGHRYETTDYEFEGKIYERRTLIADVMMEHFHFDRVYLVGTAQSMWENVAEVFGGSEEYQLKLMEKKERGTLTEEDLEELGRLLDARASKGSRAMIVEKGETEEEWWRIFDMFFSIYDAMEKEDELHFDITHLFRSHSVLAFVIGELGGIFKDVRVKGLYYGMFTKGKASPIVDMSMFFELLDWAKAVRNLKRYGNPMFLTEMVPTLGSEEATRTFKNFAESLAVSDMAALIASIKVLQGKLDIFEKLESRMADIVLGELRNFIDRFRGKLDDIGDFQYELAKFYLETSNYPMFYITLTEAIVSKVCEVEKLDPTIEDDRNEAKRIILKEYRNGPKDFVNKVFYKVNGIRINIAHKTGGDDRYKRSAPKDIVTNASKYFQELAPLFRES
jgi:CRISPR-associated Csx2 family protein